MQDDNQPKLPQHVAIIPDGNRRWAKQRNLPTLEGHRRGLQQMEKIAKTARDMGIPILTVWGFSTENWQRAEEEVEYLNKIIMSGLKRLAKQAKENQVRICHLGRRDRLSPDLLRLINQVESDTAECRQSRLNIALDYGGRDELVRAIKKMMNEGITSQEISDEVISQYLDTGLAADPDVIIRTSGEHRTSGLMPWQSVYAEYIFTDTMMPDFGPEQFRQAISEFQQRQRRYGK